MKVTYNKLWKLLIDMGMKKTDLLDVISTATLAKLSKNENVSTDTLIRICEKLGCKINDIIDSNEEV